MMPTVRRRSGPDFVRDGAIVSPKALIHFCEGCGAEGAPFLFYDGRKMLSWCAYSNGTGYCAKTGPVEAARAETPPAVKPVAEPTLF